MRTRFSPVFVVAFLCYRSVAHPADTASVVSCDGDVTDRLKYAIDTNTIRGQPVTLYAPTSSKICTIHEPLHIPPGMQMLGVNDPIIELHEHGQAFVGDTKTIGFVLKDITIDGQNSPTANAIDLQGSSFGLIENIKINNTGGGIALKDNSANITIRQLTTLNIHQHAISIIDSDNNIVDNATLNDQLGFGVIITGTSNGNRLNEIKTTHSGLELVGMTVKTHDNLLTNSKAVNTGDNCFSITGTHNIMRNLIGEKCAGNGITFYGTHNILDGGYFIDNNQKYMVRKAWSAAIQFSQGFGGVAQYNVAKNVTVDDDQDNATQQVGVMTYGVLYQIWTPHTPVSSGEYRYFGLSLYKSTGKGVTGNSHPSGVKSFNDGGVTWEYTSSFEGTTLPDNNHAENIEIRRVARARREDQSEAKNNFGTR